MSRLAPLFAVITAACVIACGTGTSTPSPTSRPTPAQSTVDVEAAARALARDTATDLLAGAGAAPFLTNWQTIQARSLPAVQKTQFCQALELPFADKIIGGIVSVGLSALSLSLRKKPIPEEAKGVIDLVASFATKTCPQWDPTRVSKQTPKPVLPWYPSGFVPLLVDPGVAWRRVGPTEANCAVGTKGPCWIYEVAALYGCPTSLFLAVAGHDASGLVIDPGEDSLGPIAANTPVRIQLTPEVAGVTSATLDYISCS
jgi:hypothetical protein